MTGHTDPHDMSRQKQIVRGGTTLQVSASKILLFIRSCNPGHSGLVTFQLTTKGVLAREQARRKSRRFNNYDNFGPDGPDY